MRPYGGLLAFSRSDWPHETKEPLSSDSRTFLAVHSHLFVCGQRVLVPGHTLWRRQQLRGTVARRCFQNVGRLREAFPPMGGVSACCCLTVLTADRRTSRGGLSGLGQHLSNRARQAGPILIPAGEAPLQEPNKKVLVHVIQQTIDPSRLRSRALPLHSGALTRHGGNTRPRPTRKKADISRVFDPKIPGRPGYRWVLASRKRFTRDFEAPRRADRENPGKIRAET